MRVKLAALLTAAALCGPARADLAVSSNDSHTVLNDGVQVAPLNAAPDTLTIIDLAAYPPSIVGHLDVPGSVVGPPTAVAIARDESFAIVTSATKADAAGPAGIGRDDRVSVIDLVPLHRGFDCLSVSRIERGQVGMVHLNSDAPSCAGLA